MMPVLPPQSRKNRRCRYVALCGAGLSAIAALALTGFMIGGLDHFSPGLDFFQTPRAFDNLLHGNSIYLTQLSSYGLYATAYLYHPFVAVAVGPWTTPFDPWTAFVLFVIASLVLLYVSARLLASAFQTVGPRVFTYFVLFCTMPTYLMLWVAQSHIFLVLAIALILSGLMRMQQDEPGAERYVRWIQLGVLISLLSKPVTLVMLPVLFVVPETRRRLLTPLAIYAAVSLLFLLVEPLNPGGFNGIHWLALLRSSAGPVVVVDYAMPRELDYLRNYHVYSLPILLGRIFGPSVAATIAKIPLAVIVGMSFLPLVLRDRLERLRTAVVVVSLCVMSLYLCHYSVNEYYYAALLPAIPTIFWLWQGETKRWLRWTLMAAFVVLLTIFLPTAHILNAEMRESLWMASTLERVIPVAMAFSCLAVYGAARAWLAVRRNEKIFAEEAYRPVGRTLAIGATMVAILAIVFVAAVTTMPLRLIKMPSTWTVEDWTEQLEYIATCQGEFPPEMYVRIHEELDSLRELKQRIRRAAETPKRRRTSGDRPLAALENRRQATTAASP